MNELFSRSHGLVRLVRTLLVLVAVLSAIGWAGGAARAADESQTHTGHGWFVLPPTSEKENVWGLYHVPPRRVDGANQGAVQFGTALARKPTNIAGVRSTVFVVLQPERGPDMRQRRVLKMRAEPVVGGGWAMNPPDRLTAVASLPAEPDLISFVGTPHGPAALLRNMDAQTKDGRRWGLKVFAADKWVDVTLPEEIQSLDEHVAAIAYPWGVAIVTWQSAPGGEARLWTTVLPTLKDLREIKEDQPVAPSWSVSTLTMPTLSWGGWAGVGKTDRIELLGVDAQVLVVHHGGKNDFEAFILRPRDSVKIASLDDVPADASWRAIQGAGSPLSTLTLAQATTEAEDQPAIGGGRLLVTWEVPDAKPTTNQALLPTPKNPKIQVVEIAPDGQMLYRGDALSTGPISKLDLQVLVSLLVLVMMSVVFFVLRDETSTAALPKGLLPGDVSRRVVAALLDFLPAAIVAGIFWGVSVASMLDPSAIVMGDKGYAPLLTAILLAWAHTTLGEWLTGASLGKSMVGCGVISMAVLANPASGPENPQADAQAGGTAPAVDAPIRRPTFVQAVVRNAVKWLLPVLGVTMLFDSLRRHPGDLLARTAVVTPEEVEEPDAE